MTFSRVSRFATVLLASSLFASACTATQSGAPAGGQSDGADASQSIDADQLKPGTAGLAVLGLTYIPNVQFAAEYVAEDDSMFTAAGQIAQLRHHGSDEGLFTALLAGDEDLVLASGDEALMARKEGHDLIAVGTYYQQNPVTIIVPENSDITKLADLKGKKIGIPGEYGSSWIGLQAILESAGMTTSDVEVVSIGYTQLAALSGSQVDAIVGFNNNEAVWFPAAGQPVRTLEMPDLPLVSASFITTKEKFDKRSNAICRLVRASEAGMLRTSELPQRAIEATQKRDETLTDADAVSRARQVLTATTKLFYTSDGVVSARPNLNKWQEMLTFYGAHFDPQFKEMKLEDIVTESCYKN